MFVWTGNNRLATGTKININENMRVHDSRLNETILCPRNIDQPLYLIFECNMTRATQFVTLQHPVPQLDWYITELDVVYADDTTCTYRMRTLIDCMDPIHLAYSLQPSLRIIPIDWTSKWTRLTM